jgi:hypothetical protein
MRNQTLIRWLAVFVSDETWKKILDSTAEATLAFFPAESLLRKQGKAL